MGVGGCDGHGSDTVLLDSWFKSVCSKVYADVCDKLCFLSECLYVGK